MFKCWRIQLTLVNIASSFENKIKKTNKKNICDVTDCLCSSPPTFGNLPKT